jgi:hypothetical protein
MLANVSIYNGGKKNRESDGAALASFPPGPCAIGRILRL